MSDHVGGRPWVLAETTWKVVSSTKYDVALLPWGATEAHNYHLPYATDVYESDWVAAESARRAWEQGTRAIALPTVPFGVNTGQLDIPFCINMNPSTQAAVLGDVVHALEGQGIRKLVIVNSHGGNDFRQMIRELSVRTRVHVSTINWWTILPVREYFDEPGDHAGELETSVMQIIAPELVLPPSDWGNGAQKRPSVAALREGWAWSPRPWTKISADTGTGNPKAATPEKGQRFLDAVTTKIASYLVDLAATDVERMYE